MVIQPASEQRVSRPFQFGLAILLIAIGFIVFMPVYVFQGTAALTVRVATVVTLGAAGILFTRDSRLLPYRGIVLALLIATLSMLLAWAVGDRPLNWLGLSLNSPQGIAVAKLSESALICLGIIVLTKLSGADLGSIFLQRGRLAWGLAIGLAAFVVLSALAIGQTVQQGITLQEIAVVAPWMLLFVFANGFMEELLFRGLFLRPYGAAIGSVATVLVTAVVFTSIHFRVTYTPDLPVFLLIVFALGLIWAVLIQKTDSLLAAFLFHAGADMLIIVGVFAAYGITF